MRVEELDAQAGRARDRVAAAPRDVERGRVGARARTVVDQDARALGQARAELVLRGGHAVGDHERRAAALEERGGRGGAEQRDGQGTAGGGQGRGVEGHEPGDRTAGIARPVGTRGRHGLVLEHDDRTCDELTEERGRRFLAREPVAGRRRGGGCVVGLEPGHLRGAGSVGCPEVERADPVGQAQEAQDLVVELALGDLARADGGEQAVAPRAVGAGHLQVEASLDRAADRLGRDPVAHDDAVEAPLLLEDPREQRAVLEHRGRGLAVVDARVGTHDAPGLGLVHDALERREVDLAQRALVEAREVARALGLGVVRDVVLDAHAHAVGLRGAHELDRDLRGQVRVLGVALEVPAAHGRALEVDLRGEDHVDAVAARLGREQRTGAGREVAVPGRGERAGGGEHRGGLRGHRGAVGQGGLAARATDAHRAVRHRDGPQADALDRGRGPHACADEEGDLLLDREVCGEAREAFLGPVDVGVGTDVDDVGGDVGRDVVGLQ